MNFFEIVGKIPVVSKMFFGLFILLSIVQLIFCFKEKRLLRMLTKPLCMLFLGGAINIAFPDHPILYSAVYLGMAGDILLIVNKKNFIFSLGVFSFFIGHIFYYIEVHKYLLNDYFEIYFHLIFWTMIVILTFVLYPFSKRLRQRKAMTFGGSLYYVTLIASLITYIIAFIFSYKIYGISYMWLSIIGVVLFIISDTFLIYSHFVKPDIKRKDFWIMLPYLLAQCLILFGFAFTYFAIN